MGKYPKLPEAFKEKWLKALRSGKFKQGQSVLKDKDKFCCLGVAARICHVPDEKFRSAAFIEDDFVKRNEKTIKKYLPKVLIGDTENILIDKLTSMNDSGKSFNKIANWIEKYL